MCCAGSTHGTERQRANAPTPNRRSEYTTSWRRAAQSPPKRRDDGRLRPADGRDCLIILPSSAKAPVQLHELFALAHLSLRVLLLEIIELTLGIDHVQKIRETAIVSGHSQIDGALAG